jgi:hypothetical protein
VTPASVQVKAAIVTGEVTEMKVTERVEKRSIRVVAKFSPCGSRERIDPAGRAKTLSRLGLRRLPATRAHNSIWPPTSSTWAVGIR